MRAAMVTPMPPESAIADVMLQAVPEITGQWQLDIWCPTESAYRATAVPVRPFAAADATVIAELSGYDLVVYVLGDSPWHSRILPLVQQLPGLVVLHDASMTNLVRHTAIEQGWLDVLVDRVADAYDDEKATLMRHGLPGDDDARWLRFCADVPLDELVTERSLGIVVHSRWHASRVDGLTLGDVTVAALPVPSARTSTEGHAGDPARRLLERLPQDAVLVVSVGMVNANRNLDRVMEAISRDPVLHERAHFWAVGAAAPGVARELRALARDLNLTEQFTITGRLSDASLQEVLARADASVALRDPVLEGQSASVLTQMLSGTPVVVYDHAHYAELPDDVVVKTKPGDSGDLVRALRALVDDPDERRARGERGRDYALASRSGSAYGAAIVEAGEKALAARPPLTMLADASDRLRLGGLAGQPAVVDLVRDLAFDLFDLA